MQNITVGKSRLMIQEPQYSNVILLPVDFEKPRHKSHNNQLGALIADLLFAVNH